MNFKIAIIAGEVSGDLLGSRLIKACKKINPNIQFEGIAGEQMQVEGCQSFYDMEKLSVMGFLEVLPRLFELLKIRHRLFQYWQKNPPDIFIGIDAPDFNLTLEKKLHHIGIPTVHYVSPSIWAWREKRVKKIKGNLDLMLTLFPFEADFYHRHHIPAEFVGHPLADEIPFHSHKKIARQQLSLSLNRKILAILPGSRKSEIQYLSPDFLQAAKILHQKHPDLIFVVPLVNEKIKQQFVSIKHKLTPNLSLHVVKKQSRIVMQAADYILLASGTAVLEGMLINRPMVAAYRVARFTAMIIRFFKLLKVKYVTLPNNLANEELVPELIQEVITPENIVKAIEQKMMESPQEEAYREKLFLKLHKKLKQNANKQAAKFILKLSTKNSYL